MSVLTGSVQKDRFSIGIHANANVQIRYCVVHLEYSMRTHAGVNVIMIECANLHSDSAIVIASVSVHVSNTAPGRRYSATKFVIASAAIDKTVLNHKHLTKRRAGVNAQQSSAVLLHSYSVKNLVIVCAPTSLKHVSIHYRFSTHEPASVHVLESLTVLVYRSSI